MKEKAEKIIVYKVQTKGRQTDQRRKFWKKKFARYFSMKIEEEVKLRYKKEG